MTDSAEAIAQVLKDIRTPGRFRWPDGFADERIKLVARVRALESETVVDVTPIYLDLFARAVDGRENLQLYESFPCITPPWENAWFGFVNRHGNVILMQTTRILRDPNKDLIEAIDPQLGMNAQAWVSPNPIDWDKVKWIADTFIWMGGRHSELPPGAANLQTTGPCHLLQAVIQEDGTPVDLHWVQLLRDVDPMTWEACQAVLSASLNFLNCKNVDATEPTRPRPARRRLQRLGVQVKTLVVRPVGSRSKAAGQPIQPGMPLTSVRGHFAEYGPKYRWPDGTPKGRLFGKIEGRFWIPAHARGSADHGEVRKDYRLEPSGGSSPTEGASTRG